ncbi:MAG: phosphatidylserine/phosphatidylglycerophosphate/cardiolipin synthase family protein [Spirochaetales bacterium]|nr:phosphatidylserine/phosphatidylglycerophosphate/cardiolipin synthase family protein [Spirochaetales bacterium]
MGCSTTNTYVKGLSTDSALSVEEKLTAFGAVPIKLGEPESYYDGKEWLDRLVELIDESQDYIFLSTFLGSQCDDLRPVYDAMIKATERGVRIYFVLDGLSSYDMTDSKNYLEPLYFLKAHGVKLIEYAPLSVSRIIAPQAMAIRDHRKLFVIDGKKAVLGGMNINYVSMGAEDKMKLQKDSMYVFDSYDLCKHLIDEFVVLWNSASVEKIKLKDFKTYSYTDYENQNMLGFLFNQGPGSKAHVADVYAALINSAEKEIVILPYLPLLDKNMLASLENAVKRGVSVKMVFPLDQRGYSEQGTKYFFHKLVDIGVECRFISSKQDAMLHEKLVVVDSKYAVIGSSNFNMRSMNLSHEIVMAIEDEKFVTRLREHIDDRAKNTIILDKETADRWKKDEGSFLMFLASYYGG